MLKLRQAKVILAGENHLIFLENIFFSKRD